MYVHIKDNSVKVTKGGSMTKPEERFLIVCMPSKAILDDLLALTMEIHKRAKGNGMREKSSVGCVLLRQIIDPKLKVP